MSNEPKGRGRPELGLKVKKIGLSEEDWELARQMGEGNQAKGIRAAMAACRLKRVKK